MTSRRDKEQSPAQHIAVSRARTVQVVQMEMLVFAGDVMFLRALVLVRAASSKHVWEWTLHG